MTPSDLKYNYEVNNRDGHFFERSSMKFFGDTMRNFGVRAAKIETWSSGSVECWELYRKRPVKHGLQNSHYFNKETFKTVIEK